MCTSPVGARKSSLRVFLSPRAIQRKALGKQPLVNDGAFPPWMCKAPESSIAQSPRSAQKSRDKPPEML
jgi:hypothetical protein